MLHRLIILILIFTLPLHALPGDTRLPTRVTRTLRKLPAYREGAKAMQGHLPDVAVRKFRLVLADKKLPSSARPYLVLTLAEALIRSSTSPQGEYSQAVEALKLLEDKTLKPLPSTIIWKAEALASLGRYKDAESILSSVPTSHRYFSQIQLARARILIALDSTPEALLILAKVTQSKSSKIRNAAYLLSAETHINHARHELAHTMLEKLDAQNPVAAKLKEYLAARLALTEEGKALEAVNRFLSLKAAPDHLNEGIFHACILGLADAQKANQQANAAITTLEQYITDYPDSLTLEAAFVRLIALLPDNLPDDAPSILKLRQWSGEAPLPEDVLYITGDSAMAIRLHQPALSEHDDLVSLSLYHRALLLARSEDKAKHALAMALLAQLRSQHPAHTLPPSELYLKLASASLIDTAYLYLKQNQPEQAAFTLSVMEKIAFSPRLKAQAISLRGHLLAKEEKPAESLKAFSEARKSTSEDIANSANFNAGIMALKASNLTAFNQIIASTLNTTIRTSLVLERALWKCSRLNPTGRTELDTFILNHPNHPRENEARMALAAACVNISPPDIILAKAEIEIISPRLTDASNQLRITRILIRAAELTQDWTTAAVVAEKFIFNFKDDPNIPSIQLKRGQLYYHNEDYNKARRIFQDIPKNHPKSPYAPYASFYAAMSARLGGTAQSREESIALFETIIKNKQPQASEARIQQSRILIDLRRYTEAEASLKPLLASQKTPASQRRDAGILMADCLHRQGISDPKKYEQAITIYNGLLKMENLPLAWKNRIHLLRGQTYESMQRVGDAFNSYYDVVIQGNNTPKLGETNHEEWHWFYRCGFRALFILETDKRWAAAVKLARHIASFKGPRAEEASKRAHSLANKHMIWEE